MEKERQIDIEYERFSVQRIAGKKANELVYQSIYH